MIAWEGLRLFFVCVVVVFMEQTVISEFMV